MNNKWSEKVQSTELLYYSRAEKFNDENKDFWFELLKIKSGMKILEVGCGGGLFTNMIKKYFHDCEVYGIDLDFNHIQFAKRTSQRLKLDVKYSVADLSKLPFKDEYFDLVFSHTVIEHVPFDDFIKDQNRVLKKNGQLVIIRVDMDKKIDYPFMEYEEDINTCYKKLIIEASNKLQVAKYLETPNITLQRLFQYNFSNINYRYDKVIYYLPDCAKVDIAKRQIERNYKCKLSNAIFNLQRATNGIEIKDELLFLLEKQFKQRLKYLENNKKIYDLQSSNIMTFYAQKN